MGQRRSGVRSRLERAATWFVRHCREVTVCDLCGSGRAVTLGPEIVHAVGFDPEEALLPWPRLAPDGYRLVQEYFTLPQKFLFLDLRPMSAARGPSASRSAFSSAPPRSRF
jgi:type VI secretion system protein ImpG